MASWVNGQEEGDVGSYSYSEEGYEQPYSPTGPSSSNFIYSNSDHSQDPRVAMAAQAHQLAQLAAGYNPRSHHLHFNAQPQVPAHGYYQPDSQSAYFSAYPPPPPSLVYGRSTLYAQSESFGVLAVGSSSHPQPPLNSPQQSWSTFSHCHAPQQPPPALAYGYYNQPPPNSAYPSAAYAFPSPESTTSSSITTRPRTYTNSSSGSASTDGTSASSYFEQSQHSGLGDARGEWEAEPHPLTGQQEVSEGVDQEEPFGEGASQDEGATVEPTSPFRSHAAAEARGEFLLEGEHDLSSISPAERFFFEPPQGMSVEGQAGSQVDAEGEFVAGEEEPRLEMETESDQLRFAEQLFGMKMYGAGGNGGAGYGGHLSASPEAIDLGELALRQPIAGPSNPSPHQSHPHSSSTFSFIPQYPSARAIAPHSTTATPRYHSPAVSPVNGRSPTKSHISDASSLTSFSSSSQSSSPVRGGPAPSGSSQLETVSAPRVLTTSPTSLFGAFQESCRVFDEKGINFNLQPEISPPAFTYDAKLGAWLGYRRNYLSLSASIVVPAPSSSLYLSPSTTSATKISHFIATTSALTLPTHLAVPLLQLDTTRKLERATPLQPSRFELPASFIKADKSGKASAPFTRVQFRNSTANHPSGASSVGGMTTRFGMRVVIEAVLEVGGAKVEVGRWESGELVIRGRSPKNFGIVTAKGREMTASASKAAKGESKDPKSKSRAKTRTSGRVKTSTPRDYSSSEEELDDEDIFLASFAQNQRRGRSAGLPPADAGRSTSTSTDESSTTGKRSITWDDYDAESLTVAKRTRSARR
ncbi:hypothetical protein BCR35DRAFT_308531 [Leucosporidium creatinivorum]|uniref:NDT80 domain-containing protein n=1 Tax=Leucosporidium creatinivorum TaxID=106004 RepID=A0A1Y2E5V1_9BASI|nr:hypothetical protein BCR35DRAFT_308531 [Leucosporidium creatinivorum]